MKSLNTWLQENFQSEDEGHVSEDERYSHPLYNKACEILIQEYHSNFRYTEQYWNLVDYIQAQSQAAWRHYLFYKQGLKVIIHHTKVSHFRVHTFSDTNSETAPPLPVNLLRNT